MTFNNQMNLQNRMMLNMTNMRGVTGTDEFPFVVMLRDSTKIKVFSAMYTDSITRKRFIILVDKKFDTKDTNRYKKIYPTQTIYLKRGVNLNDDSSSDVRLKGKPNDSCWMFKVVRGTITAYSYLTHGDFTSFNQSAITGIQLIDGPIVKCSEENLQKMIRPNDAAMEYFRDKKYLKAIKKFNRDIDNAPNP